MSPVISPSPLDRLHATMRAIIRGDMGPIGDMSLRQLAILAEVCAAKSFLTVRGISQTLDVSRSSVSGNVQYLVRLGLLDSQPDPGDGRNVLITSTSAGRKAARALANHLQVQP